MTDEERRDGEDTRDFEAEYFPEDAEADDAPEASEDDPDAPSRSRGQRGCGCLLRLLRFPLYLVVLVLLILAGVWLWLQSDDAQQRGAVLLEARLSEYFGRNVEIGEVTWSLFPLAIEARDVVIPGDVERDGSDARPFARVPYVVVQVSLKDWTAWQDPILEVEQVMATGPEVTLVVREDGSNNLPRFGQRREGASRVEVRMSERPASTSAPPAEATSMTAMCGRTSIANTSPVNASAVPVRSRNSRAVPSAVIPMASTIHASLATPAGQTSIVGANSTSAAYRRRLCPGSQTSNARTNSTCPIHASRPNTTKPVNRDGPSTA